MRWSELEDVLSRFEHVRRSGNGWRCKCPVHNTKNVSMRILLGEKRINFHCFAGCSSDAILEAIGLTWSDAYYADDPIPPSIRRRIARVAEPAAWLTREDIEFEHDYGTMPEFEYHERLLAWSGRRTWVELDDQGEVTQYALLPYKRQADEQQGHRSSGSAGNTSHGDEPFVPSRPAAQ